jgi:hypothetical protein
MSAEIEDRDRDIVVQAGLDTAQFEASRWSASRSACGSPFVRFSVPSVRFGRPVSVFWMSDHWPTGMPGLLDRLYAEDH